MTAAAEADCETELQRSFDTLASKLPPAAAAIAVIVPLAAARGRRAP